MKWFDEFKTFIQRGNVIDLAVAVIIGAAFTSIVTSFVNDVVTPILGVATKGGDIFSGFDIPLWGDAVIRLGKFLQAILNFLIIAFCVFWMVKAINTLRIHTLLEGGPKPLELTTQEKLLTEIRDLLKGQQMPDALPGVLMTEGIMEKK